MATDFALHEGFILHATPEKYVLQPRQSTRELVFDRSSGDIVLTPRGSSQTTAAKQGKPIFAVFGVISLPTFDLLVLVTSAKVRGKLFGHPIYLASHFLLLPITTKKVDHPAETRLISLVYRHLLDGSFWFSYEWDLTRNLQVQALDGMESRPMCEGADDRFYWNKFLQSRLTKLAKSTSDREYYRFIMPLVYGFFDIKQTFIHTQSLQLCLLSRRSRYRAGMRYFTRGVDNAGHAGNFNETEQILIIHSDPVRATSFVQTRGSAPFHWAEIVNLIRVPDLIVMDHGEGSRSAFNAHVADQQSRYGKLKFLNLVKGMGREKHIKDAFEKYAVDEKVPEGVSYEFFDAHTETLHGQWHRVDEESEALNDTLVEFGYFESSGDAEPRSIPAKTQQGVIRSNCMDCLDRTNMMQASLAKRVLDQQLHDLGILDDSQSVINEAAVMEIFRNQWADHANAIAGAYTGTRALRTDFTRNGVRTRKGVVTDKMTSLWRYIMNNHVDGYKQDAFDLMTGNWDARRDPTYVWMLLRDKRHWAVRLTPLLFFFALLMILLTSLLPRSSPYSSLYPLSLWTSLAIITGAYIASNPIDYVRWPRLNYQPILDAIYYTGPGARTTKGSIARGGGVVERVDKGRTTILKEALTAP